MRTEHIAAVLLAAGTSSRFGEDDKLMATLRGKPLVAHTLETVASMAFAELVAVTRPIDQAPVIHRKLDRRGFTILVNDRPAEGISGSIIRAVEHVMPINRIRGILICLADMPDVLQDRFAARFENLADWEQASIIAGLERVAALLNAEGIDASPVLDVGALD